MDFGHGFLPRIDARNYKAMERCLTRGAEGLFHEGLDLPWAILEGPWAMQRGSATIELCRERSVSYLVDTQAWRYREPDTFSVEKFASVPHAPTRPLPASSRDSVRDYVAADLDAQASLGASAFLLPGLVPRHKEDDVAGATLELLDMAQADVLSSPRPCIAFVGAHTSSIDDAFAFVDELPHWITGVYLQFTPINPLRDSPSKIIDCLALLQHARQRGFIVIAGRLAGLGSLARALGVNATDSGLGEGESFVFGAKIRNQQPRETSSHARPVGGRLYVPQLNRSLSSAEWCRLMKLPVLRGQLLCKLVCCAFGQPIDSTPRRGREHSLHARVAEAKEVPTGASATALDAVVRLLEQRRSTLRLISNALESADHEPLQTDFIDNHVAAARFLRDAASEVA